MNSQSDEVTRNSVRRESRGNGAPGGTHSGPRSFPRRAFGYLCGSPMVVGFLALCASLLLWLLGCLRFMFPNVRVEPPTTFNVGRPSDYAEGQVETKYKARYGVWVVRHEYEGQTQIYVLKAVCTHLGCTPNWLETEQRFKCPCHGSGFYKSGIHFEGPAPRPLERYAIRIAEDGEMEVDKSRSFQQELGEWTEEDCYVAV